MGIPVESLKRLFQIDQTVLVQILKIACFEGDQIDDLTSMFHQ